jgi:hypothetical protein
MYKRGSTFPASSAHSSLSSWTEISAFAMRASGKSIVPSKDRAGSRGCSDLTGQRLRANASKRFAEAVCTSAEQGCYEAAGTRIQISE